MTVELRNVVKTMGAETHIYETSLKLAQTGFNVLLGETGAGKTTLMKLVAGLERPTSGSVLINGRDVTKVSPQKRNVAFVHQFFINYPNMTVYENIASPLRVAGVPRSEIDQRVREAADLMQIGPMLERRPNELSGGQQQRTALARAVVKDADVVLLDEPLVNLDYKLREEMRDELPKLFAGRGAVVVYATSEPTEALLLGGRTATVQQGRVTEYEDTGHLYRWPRWQASAEVFSDPPINIAAVTKAGTEIRMDGGARWSAAGPIAEAPDGPYTMAVRPHFVTPTQRTEAAVRISGTVLVTELSGSESVAHFDLGPRTWVSQSHGVHPYRVGETHDFFIDTDGCLYFDADGRRVGAPADDAAAEGEGNG